MEEFIDYILIALVILVIVFTSLLIFLLLHNPSIGYWLLGGAFVGLITGMGVIIRRAYQKRRLGEYYELFRELSQSTKDIKRSTKRLERHTRKSVKEQFPKIRTLCHETRNRLHQIVDIDKTLHTFERQEFSKSQHSSSQMTHDRHTAEKIYASSKRHQENIRKIERSKQQYLQDVHQVIRFLYELNSQILALRYSQKKGEIQLQIAETIDELLIDIQTLEEIS